MLGYKYRDFAEGMFNKYVPKSWRLGKQAARGMEPFRHLPDEEGEEKPKEVVTKLPNANIVFRCQ